MKTALLQCNPVTGDIAGNIERISQAVRRAGKVDLCVTPELALSGVAPGDFLSMNDFVEGCRKGLDILAARFVSGPDLLVGAPVVSVYEPSLLSNAAVYIHRGQWDVISRKVRPEASRDPDAEFFDRGVSLGIVNLAGWRLGIVLCEEDSNSSFWTVRGTGYMPLLDLISRGVDAIIHMRATPYVIGKRADHEAMLTHPQAQSTRAARPLPRTRSSWTWQRARPLWRLLAEAGRKTFSEPLCSAPGTLSTSAAGKRPW